MLAGLALLLLPLTACGNVCPAIGWSNTLRIQFDGDVSVVSHVQICADGHCSTPVPGDGGVSLDDEPLRTGEPGQQGTARSPEPTGEAAPDSSSQSTWAVSGDLYLSIEQTENGSWNVNMTAAPENIEVRALSETGKVLAEQHAVLSWNRVGGSARCGGPSESEVTIVLGA